MGLFFIANFLNFQRIVSSVPLYSRTYKIKIFKTTLFAKKPFENIKKLNIDEPIKCLNLVTVY